MIRSLSRLWMYRLESARAQAAERVRTPAKNGGMGGMSGKMSPSAVLLIKNGQTRLVNIKNQDSVSKVIDMIPDLVDRFTTPKQEMMSDEEAVDAAFPEEDGNEA